MYKFYTKLWCKPPGYAKQFLRVMKILLILMTSVLMQVSASTFAQKITLNEKQASLVSIFEKINRQSGVDFLVNIDLLAKAKPVSINVNNEELSVVLDKIFEDQPLEYTVKDRAVLVTKKTPTFLERLVNRWAAIDVHGRVVDKEGQPLPGATVKVKGTGKSVSANAKGEFYLEKVEEGAELVISFIGYVSKELKASNEMGHIVLELSDSKLDEVQVIAYGTTTQRLSTGNVTTIKAEDIAKSPVSNPLLAIAGRIPGVFIQQSAGVPGSGVKIVIQGQNSIGYGNDPFYVIDGVPYTSQLLPGLGGGILGDSGPGTPAGQPGTAGNPLDFINPQDIESIDILKDADATSIYGSRAANGAIIITTKKGKAGKTSINLNAQQGWGRVARKVKLLNTQQYLETRREAYTNANLPIPTDYNTGNYELTAWDQQRNTDWQKELIGGLAQYTNINGSITGGNATTQYLFSGGYQNEGTVTPGDLSNPKGSIHFSLNNISENNRFRFNFSGNYMTSNNKLGQMSLFSTAAFTLPPNAPKLYNETGELNWDYLPNGVNSWSNPLVELSRGYVNKTTNLVSNSIIGYQIIPNLELKSSFGYNRLQSNETSTIPLTAAAPHIRPLVNRIANFNTAQIDSWIIEPQISYVKTLLSGKLDVLVGTTFQQENRDRQKLDATGFSSDAAMSNLKAAASVKVGPEPNAVILSEYKYHAFFCRLNYNLADKYILNVSARRDGSSRFGSANRFHNFASVAGAWLFSNESIIKTALPFLSFGKIRASYGTTGSDQIGDYAYLNLYQNTPILGGATSYQDILGLEPFDDFPNPYLQWEETKKISGTLDLGFFKDRLLINATFYRNRTSNQLQFQHFATSVTGGTGVKTNKPATVQNSGLEMGLNTVNITSKDFNWSSSMNLTVSRNKLISITGTSADLQNDFVGKPLGVQRVYHFLGVDPLTGLYTVADKDGKATSTPDASKDMTVYIDLNPSFYGGFQNTFSYKGISLEVLFQFIKQKAANEIFGFYPGRFYRNQPISVLDRWRKPGDQALIQKYDASYSSFPQYQMAIQSDKRISDASYIRLKNLSLSYQLPTTWVNSAYIKNARVFMQGQNLITITNYVGADPENRTFSGMPILKVLTMGIQIGL